MDSGIINIRMQIAYDGTNYQGWQRGSAGKSIEEVLEKALALIYQQPMALQAASRTDAGVHARGQVVNFFAPKVLDLQKLVFRLNQLLPKDVIVVSAQHAADGFHPSQDAIAKEYRYYICNAQQQQPFNRLYAWHIPQALMHDAIDAGMALLTGKHDFRAFCNQRPCHSYENYVREVYALEKIYDEGLHRFYFALKGDRFLYRMARNMVGTLIDVGLGKIAVQRLSEIIALRDRRLAGVAAPAHGLFLQTVFY